MKHPGFITALIALAGLPAVFAQTPALTYIPNSSVKLYQVNGDCDWAVWDATINNKTPTCKPTASQTATKADVLGDDVPVAFENNGELIVTFGDTIGALGYNAWTNVQNTFQWDAHDPIAHSTTVNASDGLLLSFFLNGTHGLEIQPPPQPNGTAVDMGADNVPNTGVSLNGTIYLGIKTGSVNVGPGDNDGSGSYSVLATFNENTFAFGSGRTISSLPNGHFVSPTFYLAPAGTLGTPAPVSPEPVMLIFGLGEYRASNIYLSIIPSTQFAGGVDQNGNPATRYFSGMSNGEPTWSSSESAAVPIVTDLNAASPTVGNLSAFYSQPLGLWLMMFDGGRGNSLTSGMYFTYAPKPWGPWSKPQLVFNDCRDKGLGNFVFYYYGTAAQNDCPSAMPAGVTAAPNSAGPSGPTIGDQTKTDPATTRGGTYAPMMVERFTIISGSTLKIFYMFSTWNPYAVVMMESDFTITPPPAISLVANAEGESPTIAPNTWVEIKGANLAPPGDTRIWQASDFVAGQMPTQLDGVSATVNGNAAYVYYISPTQVNILTPSDAMSGAVQVVVTNNGPASAAYTAQAQPLSPSFFVIDGGPYVLAQHGADNSLVGPASFSVPGYTFTPAKPGETVVLYANGFGPISPAVVSSASSQTGTLNPLPTVTIGGTPATVNFAGINGPPGLFQFNVVVPPNVPSGDNTLTATYNGATTAPMALITILGSAPATVDTFYVALNGNDSWSGTLADPNPANTDGPFATFDHARAAVRALNKTGLKQVAVQFRGGTYFLPATETLAAADSGSATTQIVYQNYPGESPIISGGVRVQNWTNVSGDTWKTTLPASTQYFENLFYNGVRRLRPRVGGSLGTYYRYVGPVYLSGPAPPANSPDPNCSEYFAGSGWECFDRFQYNPTDPIVSTWKNLAPPAGNHCSEPAGNPALAGDIELVNFEQYSVSKMRLSCVDTVNHIVYLTGVTATEADHPTSHGFIPNHRYLIENVEDELTQPGQWFLDRSATPWTLAYLANPGENPNTDTVMVPQLTQVLVASNLQFVTFQGLTFEHDNYTMPTTGYDGTSEIIAGVSFQNSQHITFDSSIVTQTSGVGLEFISCIDKSSLNWCVSNSAAGVAANNVIENSALYDLGAGGIRIGTSGSPSDTNANVPQFNTVQNTVVEGYGRVYTSSKGIAQGQGHDNLYTHNDVYDGYKGAIKVCYCADSDVNPPFTNNNTISFNHVYNLFQGIMNDSGSLYFGVGTPSPPSSGTGNKMLNNKVHDVSDASALDADGYGGDGLYADDFSGQVDMENNLVYRVSGNAVSFSGPRAGPNQSSTVKNNILAFARQSLLNAYDPYSFNTEPPQPMFFTASNNLLYFDRNGAESFYVQGGCTYPGAIAYTAYQQWTGNLYWRTDGGFATDPQAFHTQKSLDANGGCGNQKLWTYFTFGGWQGLGEDLPSVVQNPGFNNPAYPADDYTLPKGSPGVGFIVFDPSQAGRSNPVIKPPAVPATFPTKPFNPATDY